MDRSSRFLAQGLDIPLSSARVRFHADHYVLLRSPCVDWCVFYAPPGVTHRVLTEKDCDSYPQTAKGYPQTTLGHP